MKRKVCNDCMFTPTEIDEFVMKNLIYCEDTHSFVHRLMKRWKKNFPETMTDAQEDAWEIVKELNKKNGSERNT